MAIDFSIPAGSVLHVVDDEALAALPDVFTYSTDNDFEKMEFGITSSGHPGLIWWKTDGTAYRVTWDPSDGSYEFSSYDGENWTTP